MQGETAVTVVGHRADGAARQRRRDDRVVRGELAKVRTACVWGRGSSCPFRPCLRRQDRAPGAGRERWWTRCDCAWLNASPWFSVDAFPSAETCGEALRRCEALETLEASGEPECSPIAEQAFGRSCDASLACAGDVVLDGEPSRVHSELSVSCGPVAAGWSCTCASDQRLGPLTVNAEHPSAACAEAATRCPDVADVLPGGPLRGLPSHPIPLP